MILFSIRCSLLVLADDQRTHNAFGDPQLTIQLAGERRAADERHQHIVAFGLVVDGISQLAGTPLLHNNVGAVLLSQSLEVRHLGGDSLLTLCPALIWAIIYFGVEALLLTAVSVIGCVVFEGLYRKLMHKPQSVGDLSAVVTGMLLAFVCPATTPLWMILIGDFFAIVVVKQLFGGIGKNFLNPALAGRAALLASYAGTMTSWLPAGTKAAIGGGMPVDVVSAATPLAYLKTGNMDGLKEIASVGDMFLGKIGGSMGEISALMLLIGGVYLLWRKVINWQTPVAYIATVAVLTLLFPKAGSGVEYMLYSIFGGGLFLGAFFMATDYATSPVTAKGQLIYGIGCGLFTVFIRYFGSYNEGVCYSIMVMNCCTALIDKYTKPVRFGVVKSDKKEAAAK